MFEGFNTRGLGYLKSPIGSVYEEFTEAHPKEHFELRVFRFSAHPGELRLQIKDPDQHIHRYTVSFRPETDPVLEIRRFLEITRENWQTRYRF
jgi:hypothetical protein